MLESSTLGGLHVHQHNRRLILSKLTLRRAKYAARGQVRSPDLLHHAGSLAETFVPGNPFSQVLRRAADHQGGAGAPVRRQAEQDVAHRLEPGGEINGDHAVPHALLEEHGSLENLPRTQLQQPEPQQRLPPRRHPSRLPVLLLRPGHVPVLLRQNPQLHQGLWALGVQGQGGGEGAGSVASRGGQPQALGMEPIRVSSVSQ
mmetsp:Transcript_10742/g.25644  ORF Transcript_10742/g.25644 Transcript_10742/m.25644 type:complete len:202 (-) Transcript_10742:796-1401(-)